MLKRIEKKILQSRFMQPAQRFIHFAALGKMYTSMMHDLSSPITALTCYATQHARHDTYGKTIVDSSQEIQKMLLLARHEPETMLQRSWVLHDIIQDTMKLLGYSAVQHNIRLVLLGDAQTHLYGNRLELQHIFINLISNAIDSYETISEKRKVQKTITVSYHTRNDYLKIYIRDFGCGMSPKIAQKSLRPFFTTKPFGSGIGLPITRHIVEKRYKGTIRITSVTDCGTCVTITIPKNHHQSVRQQKNYQHRTH